VRTLKSFLTVIGAVTILVLAGNTVALATTGHALILGKANKANKSTTLKRTTNGPALNLVTKPSSTAPFSVSSNGKVANLNADLLDGLDATSLQTRPIIYRIPSEVGATTFQVTFPGLPPGLYHVSYSVIAHMAAATATIGCDIEPIGGGFYELPSYGSTMGNSYSTTSASGVIDTRATARKFHCFTTGGAATVDFDYPHQSQVVLTPIDASTDTTASPARVAGRAAGAVR
jgi:hypothetical protein